MCLFTVNKKKIKMQCYETNLSAYLSIFERIKSSPPCNQKHCHDEKVFLGYLSDSQAISFNIFGSVADIISELSLGQQEGHLYQCANSIYLNFV